MWIVDPAEIQPGNVRNEDGENAVKVEEEADCSAADSQLDAFATMEDLSHSIPQAISQASNTLRTKVSFHRASSQRATIILTS
jgi:hypothetical protein